MDWTFKFDDEINEIAFLMVSLISRLTFLKTFSWKTINNFAQYNAFAFGITIFLWCYQCFRQPNLS